MLERTQELDRDRTSMTRTATRMRDGHRREYDPRQAGERLSFRQRCERALADVGIYRSVSFRDLAEPHFGGHPYTARRAVNRWIRAGMMGEHTAKGPKGKPFKVLTLTQRGAEKARRAARGQGLDRQQRTWAGLVKRSELTHDTEVYRACGLERRRLADQGASIRRVRIDSELKSTVARRSERPLGSWGCPSMSKAACSIRTLSWSTRMQTGAKGGSTSRSPQNTTATNPSSPNQMPGLPCTPRGQPKHVCSGRSAVARAKEMTAPQVPLKGTWPP